MKGKNGLVCLLVVAIAAWLTGRAMAGGSSSEVPGEFFGGLEYSGVSDSFAIEFEGNYPDGGMIVKWDTEINEWVLFRASSAPEYQNLAAFTLAALNGKPLPFPVDGNMWLHYHEIEMRAIRDFQRSLIEFSFAPVVTR